MEHGTWHDRGMAQIAVPDTARAEEWLRGSDDPNVRLLVATYLDGSGADRSELVSAAMEAPVIRSALAGQRADGSWGADGPPWKRIPQTLWMMKTLAEIGLGATGAWTRGAEFLAVTAHTDDAVFAIDGRRDGVLSCYVGLAATTYLLGGRTDLAQPQVRWIRDHQQVRRAGVDRRATPASHWSEHLAVRYGGCMSDTTCLVGLVKTGQALRCWLTSQPDPDIEALLGAIQLQFLERQLFRASDGSTLPLGVTPSKAASWLDLTYPLDWRTDLVEVIDLVATEEHDVRLQPALAQLLRCQLDDGSWPLQRTFRPDALAPLERRRAVRGSPYVSLRVLCALAKLGPTAV